MTVSRLRQQSLADLHLDSMQAAAASSSVGFRQFYATNNTNTRKRDEERPSGYEATVDCENSASSFGEDETIHEDHEGGT